MTINTLPTAPNRSMTPAEFVAAADAFVAALPVFSSQVNTDVSVLLTLTQLVSVSTTSLTIGTGSKALTVETSKAYVAGQVLRIYSTASSDNYMDGTVTSYDTGTGALVVNVTSVVGSGTFAAWTVILNGGLATAADIALRALLNGSATEVFSAAAATAGTHVVNRDFGDARYATQTNGPVISSTRNSKMVVTAAAATGTFTADEVVVSTALGGSVLKLASYSQAINLATTGAGGMDTGSAPASGFVSLYAISKDDGTASILACNVTTSSGEVYGGANMPALYTHSALLGIWATNGSSQFVIGSIIGRRFTPDAPVAIFTNNAAITSLTSQSISAGAPAAAKTASFLVGSGISGGTFVLTVASSATGGGKAVCQVTSAAAFATLSGVASLYGVDTITDIPIITAQTVWVMSGTGVASLYLYLVDFTF